MTSKRDRSTRDLPLDDIYDEIVDDMKRSGAFDELRVSLMEPIWSDPAIEHVRETFIGEVEVFCQRVDLSQNRNALRAKLARNFDSYSASRRELKKHIDDFFHKRKDEIKDNYFKNGRNYLKKFLPRTSPSPEPIENPTDDKVIETSNAKVEPKLEPVEDRLKANSAQDDGTKANQLTPGQSVVAPDAESEHLQADVDMDIETSPFKEEEDEEIEHPPYSPIRPEFENIEDIPLPPTDIEDENPPKESSGQAEDANSENFENVENDDFDRLTFSSVSSVKTDDLSEFDNSIKLSDDEASIVGKPKNSKVPCHELNAVLEQTQIKHEAEQTDANGQTEVAESAEVSESDGGCSETTMTGRRVARNRKSNPRYSNEHFKLYKG